MVAAPAAERGLAVLVGGVCGAVGAPSRLGAYSGSALLVLVTLFCWPLKAQSQTVGVFVAVLGHTALHSPLQ